MQRAVDVEVCGGPRESPPVPTGESLLLQSTPREPSPPGESQWSLLWSECKAVTEGLKVYTGNEKFRL